MATCTIVIPTYNEQSFIFDCLRSVMDYAVEISPNETDVIVVDTLSTDRTVELASRFDCTIIQAGERTYPGKARNLGAATSTSKILIFIDGDVVLTEKWSQAFQSYIEGFSNKCSANDVTGATYDVSRAPGWIDRYWFSPLALRGGKYINGGNLIVKRDVFDLLGGFDEQLETGEDVDFCRRAARHGFTVNNDPNWESRHEGFPSSISGFIARERWHGVSDFNSWSAISSSKIAIATLLFFVGHVTLVIGVLVFLIFGAIGLWGIFIGLVSIAMICAAKLHAILQRVSLGQIVFGLGLSYLYFIGRSQSLVDSFVSKWQKISR